MDRWAWEQLEPWLTIRAGLPVGALFCVLRGPLAPVLAPQLGFAFSRETQHRAGCAAASHHTSFGTHTPSR